LVIFHEIWGMNATPLTRHSAEEESLNARERYPTPDEPSSFSTMLYDEATTTKDLDSDQPTDEFPRKRHDVKVQASPAAFPKSQRECDLDAASTEDIFLA
jgi:hypothetical protein